MMEQGGRATLHIGENEQSREAFMALQAWKRVREQVAVRMDLSSDAEPYLVMDDRRGDAHKDAIGATAIKGLLPVLCHEFNSMSAMFRVTRA